MEPPKTLGFGRFRRLLCLPHGLWYNTTRYVVAAGSPNLVDAMVLQPTAAMAPADRGSRAIRGPFIMQLHASGPMPSRVSLPFLPLCGSESHRSISGGGRTCRGLYVGASTILLLALILSFLPCVEPSLMCFAPLSSSQAYDSSFTISSNKRHSLVTVLHCCTVIGQHIA